MRLLLIDHGCCDFPAGRAHGCRRGLEEIGDHAAVCGPASVPTLAAQQPGLHGIHLHDIAAASRRFLAAVRDGSPEAFLKAVAAISPGLLGLVREAARQTIAEAVDAVDPEAIFVLHAGILTDLAIETGIPVAVHVSLSDLAAADGAAAMRTLVAAAIGSCNAVVAADDATAAILREHWLAAEGDWHEPPETIAVWPIGDECRAAAIAAACRDAIAHRRGPG
jgi:hypothetical protein